MLAASSTSARKLAATQPNRLAATAPRAPLTSSEREDVVQDLLAALQRVDEAHFDHVRARVALEEAATSPSKRRTLVTQDDLSVGVGAAQTLAPPAAPAPSLAATFSATSSSAFSAATGGGAELAAPVHLFSDAVVKSQREAATFEHWWHGAPSDLRLRADAHVAPLAASQELRAFSTHRLLSHVLKFWDAAHTQRRCDMTNIVFEHFTATYGSCLGPSGAAQLHSFLEAARTSDTAQHGFLWVFNRAAGLSGRPADYNPHFSAATMAVLRAVHRTWHDRRASLSAALAAGMPTLHASADYLEPRRIHPASAVAVVLRLLTLSPEFSQAGLQRFTELCGVSGRHTLVAGSSGTRSRSGSRTGALASPRATTPSRRLSAGAASVGARGRAATRGDDANSGPYLAWTWSARGRRELVDFLLRSLTGLATVPFCPDAEAPEDEASEEGGAEAALAMPLPPLGEVLYTEGGWAALLQHTFANAATLPTLQVDDFVAGLMACWEREYRRTGAALDAGFAAKLGAHRSGLRALIDMYYEEHLGPVLAGIEAGCGNVHSAARDIPELKAEFLAALATAGGSHAGMAAATSTTVATAAGSASATVALWRSIAQRATAALAAAEAASRAAAGAGEAALSLPTLLAEADAAWLAKAIATVGAATRAAENTTIAACLEACLDTARDGEGDAIDASLRKRVADLEAKLAAAHASNVELTAEVAALRAALAEATAAAAAAGAAASASLGAAQAAAAAATTRAEEAEARASAAEARAVTVAATAPKAPVAVSTPASITSCVSGSKASGRGDYVSRRFTIHDPRGEGVTAVADLLVMTAGDGGRLPYLPTHHPNVLNQPPQAFVAGVFCCGSSKSAAAAAAASAAAGDATNAPPAVSLEAQKSTRGRGCNIM